jgi:hypothetical protein
MLPARRLPIKLRHELGRRHHYPICAHVEYRLCEDGVWSSGAGRTIYLSSGSVQIETEHGLPLGAMVELAVTWPARLDNHVCLKLRITGRTVGVKGGCTTINIARYEFRTRASPARKDPILQRDLAVLQCDLTAGSSASLSVL